jgi:hypothetical protein
VREIQTMQESGRDGGGARVPGVLRVFLKGGIIDPPLPDSNLAEK